MAHKKRNKMDIMYKIMAAIMAVLMIVAVAGATIYYLLYSL